MPAALAHRLTRTTRVAACATMAFALLLAVWLSANPARSAVAAGASINVTANIVGSTTIDLTGQREDPNTSADGFEPARHRLGLAYDDECVEFGLTWRRDYQDRGDARRGNTFLLRVAFKGLGR